MIPTASKGKETEGSMVDLSIVFCTSSSRDLEEFAASLVALRSLAPALNWELLVIRPSEAETFEKPKIPSSDGLSFRELSTPWGNRNLSRNKGYSEAKGRWVYFCDQDTRLPASESFARELRELPSLPPDLWMLSGPYLSDPSCTFWGRGYNVLSNFWLASSARGHRVLAGNLLLRGGLFEGKPFSERLTSGGEEIDLCERVAAAGGESRLRGGLAIVHLCRHSLSALWKRFTEHADVKRALRSSHKQSFIPTGAGAWKGLASPAAWSTLLVWVAATAWSSLRKGAVSNSRGFSLAEVLAYALLLGVTLLAAFTILSSNVQISTAFNDRTQSEEELLRVEGALKSAIGQALRVVHSTGGGGGGNGWIRSFDSTTMAGNMINWGVFQREAASLRRPGPPVQDSDIRNTGLFFIRPQLTGGTETAGVLLIDPDADRNGLVQPNYSTNIFFGNLVSLTVGNPRSTSTGLGGIPPRLMSIDITVTMRYFDLNRFRNERCFRPTGCPAGKGGRDERRVFTVLLRNNTYGTHPTFTSLEEGTFGNLYFFQMMRRGR